MSGPEVPSIMPCAPIDTFWCHAKVHPGWLMTGVNRGTAGAPEVGFGCVVACGSVDDEAPIDGCAVTVLVIVTIGVGRSPLPRPMRGPPKAPVMKAAPRVHSPIKIAPISCPSLNLIRIPVWLRLAFRRVSLSVQLIALPVVWSRRDHEISCDRTRMSNVSRCEYESARHS